MGVLVCGVEVGFFLCGGVWFFWWFHGMGLRLGLPMGLSVSLGLRYGLLWFGSSGGLGGWAWLENGTGLH